MTRPIKFRVWDKKEKEYPGDGMIYFFDIIAGRNKRYVTEQFTGLLDKNGVEIYEGDILKIRAFGYPAEVRFDQKRFAFMLALKRLSSDYGYLENLARGEWGSFEVIGTIHDKEKK